VLAGLQGGNSDLGVRGVGRADTYRIDFVLSQQRLDRGICLPTVFLRQLRSARLVEVIIRHQLGVRMAGILGDMPYLSDFSAANDADLDHNFTPPKMEITTETRRARSLRKRIEEKIKE
jgi:hypothetical protein